MRRMPPGIILFSEKPNIREYNIRYMYLEESLTNGEKCAIEEGNIHPLSVNRKSGISCIAIFQYVV